MDSETSFADIIEYWLGDTRDVWPATELTRRWFRSSVARDREIDDLFGARVRAALAGDLTEWEEQPTSRMALILLLDQFTRNVFRGTGRAFAGDSRAAALVTDGLARRLDRSLCWAGQVFFYMPLMHAEDLTLQRQGEHCFADLRERVPKRLRRTIGNSLKFASEHRAIIERFGRFPHRNQALGRVSSTAEKEFLATASRWGQ